MKNFKYTLLAIAAVTMLATSCTSYKQAVPVAPMNAQVNLTMNDLQYIGEATGTAEQSYFVGLPIGGRKYHSGVAVSQMSLNNVGNLIPINRGYNNALYDALKKYPDADFILPISVTTTTVHQFLGRRDMLTVRFKVYRVK